jgi:hypothetical protein
MAAVALNDVVYVIDENLLRLGKGILAIRHDTARFGEHPVAELLPQGIEDPDWIPVVGDNGWILITNDRRIRTRPVEAQLAIKHRLKVVHLHGKIGHAPAWEQLTRLTARWEAIERHAERYPAGPWWLSVQRNSLVVRGYEPGKAERA